MNERDLISISKEFLLLLSLRRWLRTTRNLHNLFWRTNSGFFSAESICWSSRAFVHMLFGLCNVHDFMKNMLIRFVPLIRLFHMQNIHFGEYYAANHFLTSAESVETWVKRFKRFQWVHACHMKSSQSTSDLIRSRLLHIVNVMWCSLIWLFCAKNMKNEKTICLRGRRWRAARICVVQFPISHQMHAMCKRWEAEGLKGFSVW